MSVKVMFGRLTPATFAVRERQEALIAHASVSTGEVLTPAVGTDAGLLTLVYVW